MKHHTFSIVLTAAALLLSANLSFAAEDKAAAPQQAASMAKASPASARIAPPVDINSATKAELKKLPGITDTDADKIIAGRPYATKANLVVNNILSEETYQSVKRLVIAKQPYQDAAKNAALYAPKKK